jgi:hypothetical protein
VRRWQRTTQLVGVVTAVAGLALASATTAGGSATTTYQVRATSLGDGSFGPVTVKAGPILEAALTMPSWTPDWSIRVRARDAAGWDSWSKAVVVGGL